MHRRTFLQLVGGAMAGGAGTAAAPFDLSYLLSSALYGAGKLEDILPEVAKTGATRIDLWPRPHGDQREQATAMGDDAFGALLEKHNVKLGCVTRYDLAPSNSLTKCAGRSVLAARRS
jgi:sugar phosphate isomerase/epimerase